MNTEIIKCDIAVLGGGAAGVMAAVSAARSGAEVILVEAQGCLGGTRTAGAVDTFYGFYTPGKAPRRIVGGLAWETVETLQLENACFERQNTYGAGTGITYDVETLKRVWESKALDAGVRILLYSTVIDVEYCHLVDGKKNIKSVCLAAKSKMISLEAALYIDTTGDADVIYSAGGQFVPLKESETLQSLTTIFSIGNVDIERALKVKHEEVLVLMKKAKESGKYDLPRLDGSFHKTQYPGVLQANMVRVTNIDATDPWQLSYAEIEGRRQAKLYADFLKDYVDGFENSQCINTAQHIGVRETRRILGQYVLSEEDVKGAMKFKDAIVCCAAPVEEHHAGASTRWVYVGGDGIYQIPYRSLLPVGLSNIITAGRCLSATHGAQASARNTAQVMAMGQAAGTAGAIALKKGITYEEVPFEELRSCLMEAGCIL